MASGKFITLEGGEGAGKSTQTQKLAAYLQGQGIETVLTREVGGSPSAEEIRALWLGKGEGHWDGLTEVLLISAARREHLVKLIWPALERGAWGISDRFMDSTRAYQGVGLGMGVDLVDHYYRHIAGKTFEPDLTLLLDVPVEAGLRRMASRGGEDDRYQRKDIAFHQTLRDAYLELAKKYPERIKVIDASLDADKVAIAVRQAARQHFALPS
jgi:dTMP kinase